LETHHLKALTELLKVYNTRNIVSANMSVFNDARTTFLSIWSRYEWDIESMSSLKMMEASMELAAIMLKSNLDSYGTEMFHIVADKATMIFSDDSSRLIWILISIGLVYQKYRNWYEASSWFENALSTAYRTLKPNDGVRKSLEAAMERRHFSYINDEARPYKSVFGVTGIAIRPARLHLD
jgi:hypothetical protein